jgi:hypothetical protein
MSYERAGLLVASTAALAYAFNVYKQRSSSKLPLPPSPGGSYPFLGHALILPTDEEHLIYARWSEELKSQSFDLPSRFMLSFFRACRRHNFSQRAWTEYHRSQLFSERDRPARTSFCHLL